MMGVERVKLRVDVLRFARRRQHREGDKEDETREPQRRHDPGLQAHHPSAHPPSVRHVRLQKISSAQAQLEPRPIRIAFEVNFPPMKQLVLFLSLVSMTLTA